MNRELPHSLEAEAAVLGAILLDQKILDVLTWLEPEDFYAKAHRIIFGEIRAMYAQGKSIDATTLISRLSARQHDLQQIGGSTYVFELIDQVSSIERAKVYAEIVKSKSTQRKLISLADLFKQRAMEEVDDVPLLIDHFEKKLFELSRRDVHQDFTLLKDALQSTFQRLQALQQRKDKVIGISTGFVELDRLTAGFQPSDLIILAARPSMGKCVEASTLVVHPFTGERKTIAQAVREKWSHILALHVPNHFRAYPIAQWVDSGVQPVLELQTASGLSIQVTHHHPFLTRQGWKPCQKLSVGDEIAKPMIVEAYGSSSKSLLELASWAWTYVQNPNQSFEQVWTLDRQSLATFVKLLWNAVSHSFGQKQCPRWDWLKDLQHALLRLGIQAILRQDGLEVNHSTSKLRLRALLMGNPWSEWPPLENSMAFETVVDIREKPPAHVFDLSVPGPENFIASDLVVHNTALSLNFAAHAAIRQKKPVAYFSLEMSKDQLTTRLLCSEARVDAQHVRSGYLSDTEWQRLIQAAKTLGPAQIYINDTPALPILQLQAMARRLKVEADIQMVIVDYLQLMRADVGKQGSREQVVSEISRGLKAVAKELNIPVIALSQLNRTLESRTDKRPINSDLRESGSIEQDADLIMFIYRDEVYHKESEAKGLAELILSKQRNGPTGVVMLKWMGDFTRFENLDPSEDYDV